MEGKWKENGRNQGGKIGRNPGRKMEEKWKDPYYLVNFNNQKYL
jgi:hypothetical protein